MAARTSFAPTARVNSALLFSALAGAMTLAAQPAPPLGLDAFMPGLHLHPLTREKVTLGRKLFFDQRLSRDNSIACSTCHDPAFQFTDRHPTARGIEGRTGDRRTPSLLNRGYGLSFFWDGRAATLEQQVLMPIDNPKEMDLDVNEAARRTGVSREQLAEALAAYVRTIRSGGSPYDKYIAGDANALNPAERRGLALFRGRAGCSACHIGPNLTDERFHNTGIGSAEGRFAVTGRESDRGAFKTPTLRNAALHPPFMHDGSLATVEAVIDFYDKGGNSNPRLDPEMLPLRLTATEKTDLALFLRSLSGTVEEGWETPPR